jgi:hypothetical protein
MKTRDVWASGRDGAKLCQHLQKRTMRKDRLLAIAFARRVLSIADEPRLEPLFRTAEAYWDNQGSWDAVRLRFSLLRSSLLQQSGPDRSPEDRRRYAARLAALSPGPDDAAKHAAIAASPDGRRRLPSERGAQAEVVRCIYANPFRPISFDSRWRTTDTLALARGIYEDRAFDHMPLLADALMDAGCDDDQILSHCRTGGPHVRGCWVVDLVLGKE